MKTQTTITLVYELENEKTSIDIQREIFDFANKGLISMTTHIEIVEED